MRIPAHVVGRGEIPEQLAVVHVVEQLAVVVLRHAPLAAGLGRLPDQRAADEIRFWVVGSLAGRRLDDLWAVLPSLLVAGVGVVLIARPLAALAPGFLRRLFFQSAPATGPKETK